MRPIQFGLVIAAAMFLIATAVKSQAPAQSGQVWEYSSVTGSPITYARTQSGINSSTYNASATICYATSQGCRNEEVATTGAGNREGSVAMMVAAAKLGEQGWELTTSAEIPEPSTNERTLYFRRLKRDSK